MPVEIIFKNDQCEWIDVEAPTGDDLIFLQKKYQINSLILEDTLDSNHLPKYEEDDQVKFFLMRENIDLKRKNLKTISDVSTKIGVFILDYVIITVHRLKNCSIYEYKKEILTEEEVSVDKIALNIALKVLRSFDDEAKKILELQDIYENEIFLQNNNESQEIRRLYRLKRKSGLNFRVLNISSQWVTKFNKLNITEGEYNDLKDSLDDVISDFDHLNAQINSLISMFLALSDQKANQVMKLLAMFSVYFLPITFIAGLYGMNFDNIPELHTPYGYFITVGIMVFIILITFMYFRRKKW
ncbi:MAG: CorA family divalent cation transporter [Flavobacteriales bacterium]